LIRTPRGPYSAAHDLVNSSSATLLDPYSAMPAMPNCATTVVTLTPLTLSSTRHGEMLAAAGGFLSGPSLALWPR
jgi:hypothetical protein